MLQRICDNPAYVKLSRAFSTTGGGLYSTSKKCDLFDIKNHIRKYDSNGEEISEATFFTKVMPELSKDFPPSRWAFPRWEWVLIGNVKFEDFQKSQMVRAFRVHHAICDGVDQGTLIGEEIMNFEESKDGRPPFIVDPRTSPRSVPGGWRGLGLKLMGWLGVPWILAESLLKKINVGDPLMLRVESKGVRHHAISRNIDLQKLKAAKDAKERTLGTKMTMTSFVCDGVKAAVKRIAGDSRQQRIWRIGFPVALLPRRSHSLQNAFFVVQADIPLDEDVAVGLRFGRGLWKHIAFMSLVHAVGRLPLSLLSRMEKEEGRSAPVPSTMLSNVPFTKSLGTIGKEGVNLVGAWSPLYVPNGMTLAFVSYGEGMRVWGVADGEVMMGQGEVKMFVDNVATFLTQLL